MATLAEKSDIRIYASVSRLFDDRKTCAEYFAGIGLVRLGLERAGWKIVFSNDRSIEKFNMYSSYFENAEQNYAIEDIFKIQTTDVPPSLLATASFPCIDLSLAGNLEGMKGKHSSALWGFLQILKKQDTRPPLILLENVSGWLTSNCGQDFRLTIRELNRLGYACDVFTIDAVRFVPQSRLRVFAIGVRTNGANNNFLALGRRSSSLTTKSLNRAISANRGLNWHFLDIPAPPENQKLTLANLVENIADTAPVWWSEDEVDRHLAMMTALNLDYLKELQARPMDSYRTMYRRVRDRKQRAELRKDEIAGCLRTAKGGSSRQILVKAGKGKVRMRFMTPREYARLQGVPDRYPLPKRTNQALTGFGDAVCVPVITWIAACVLNPLAAAILQGKSIHHF